MAFFYNPPPPPPTASYAPPVPHRAQPTAGNEPPRRQVQSALAMVAVLASWPASLEPRLQAPNNQQVKIAPLTLPTGQQPAPRQAFRLPTVWWNPPTWPAQTAPGIAGASPPVAQGPIAGSTTTTEILIGRLWPQGWTLPPRLATLVQPSTGDQPAPQGPLTTTEIGVLVRSWPTDWPAQSRPIDVVQTTGDQPVAQGPITASELSEVYRSWPTDWPAQTAPKNAAWNVPPVVNIPTPQGPLTTAETVLLVASWPTQWAAQSRPIRVVQPSTGDQPVPSGPVTASEMSEFVRSWPTDWPAQRAPKCAAWLTAPPVNLAYTPPPRLLWMAWEPPPPLPTRPVSIVTAILPIGTAPPPVKALSAANQRAIGAQWQPNWSAQGAPPLIQGGPIMFKAEWAQNSNQLIGPKPSQPETH